MKIASSLHAMRRAGLATLGALAALSLLAPGVSAQSWMTHAVSGSGAAAVVNSGGSTQQVANAAIAADTVGQQASADLTGISLAQLTANVGSAVTAGEGGSDGLATAQTVSSAAAVNLLSGLITADRVVSVASVVANGKTLTADGSGSSVTNLVVNGVLQAGGADFTPAPNTRINLPNGAYVILNEQIQTGHGASGLTMTVNMIHLYTSTGDIVVGSSSSTIS